MAEGALGRGRMGIVTQELQFLLGVRDEASDEFESFDLKVGSLIKRVGYALGEFAEFENVTVKTTQAFVEAIKRQELYIRGLEGVARVWEPIRASAEALGESVEPLKRISGLAKRIFITKEMAQGVSMWASLWNSKVSEIWTNFREGAAGSVGELREFSRVLLDEAKRMFGGLALSRIFWKRLADRGVVSREFYRVITRNLERDRDFSLYARKFWQGVAKWSKDFWSSTFGQVFGAMALVRMLERMFGPLLDMMEYLMQSALFPLISEINAFLVQLVPLVQKVLWPITDALSSIVNALTSAGGETSAALASLTDVVGVMGSVFGDFFEIAGALLKVVLEFKPVAIVLGGLFGVMLTAAVGAAVWNLGRYLFYSNQVAKTTWTILRFIWSKITAWWTLAKTEGLAGTALSKYLGVFKSALVWIKRGVVNIWGWIASIKWEVFWTKTSAFFAGLKGKVLGGLALAYKAVVAAASSFVGILSRCINFIWDSVKAVGKLVVEYGVLAAAKLRLIAVSAWEVISTKAVTLASVTLTGVLTGLSWASLGLGFVWKSLVVIGGVLSSALLGLSSAIWAATLATVKFTIALLANPLTWIIGAVVAGVALLAYAVWKFWEPIKSAFGWLWDLVKGVWNFITGTAQKIWTFVKKWAPLIAMVVLGPIGLIAGGVTLLFKNWEKVKGVVSKAVGWVKGAAVGIAKGVASAASNVWSGVKGVVGGVLGFVGRGVKSVVFGAWGLVKGVGSRLVGWFGSLGKGWASFREKAVGVLKSVAGYLGINLGSVKEFGKSVLSFLVNPFGSLGKAAWNALSSIFGGFNKLFGWFKAIKLPGWVMRLLGLERAEVVKAETQRVGEAMASGIAEGQKEAAPRVAQATEQMVSESAKYLPSSDAKAGPLSRLSEMGESLVKTFAEGMKAQRMSLLGVLNQVLGFVFKGLRPPMRVAAVGVQNLNIGEVKVPLESLSPEKISEPIVAALKEQVNRLMAFIEEMVQMRKDLDVSDLSKIAEFRLP